MQCSELAVGQLSILFFHCKYSRLLFPLASSWRFALCSIWYASDFNCDDFLSHSSFSLVKLLQSNAFFDVNEMKMNLLLGYGSVSCHRLWFFRLMLRIPNHFHKKGVVKRGKDEVWVELCVHVSCSQCSFCIIGHCKLKLFCWHKFLMRNSKREPIKFLCFIDVRASKSMDMGLHLILYSFYDYNSHFSMLWIVNEICANRKQIKLKRTPEKEV